MGLFNGSHSYVRSQVASFRQLYCAVAIYHPLAIDGGEMYLLFCIFRMFAIYFCVQNIKIMVFTMWGLLRRCERRRIEIFMMAGPRIHNGLAIQVSVDFFLLLGKHKTVLLFVFYIQSSFYSFNFYFFWFFYNLVSVLFNFYNK